jgi:parallel beta-helix repeat protein
LRNNTANYNRDTGIFLTGRDVLYVCVNNMLENNTANSNGEYGIHLDDTCNNYLTGNTMSGNKYNFRVASSFTDLSVYTHNVDTSNKVEGKPIYFLVDKKDQQIPTDAGTVCVVNSTNITVRDLTLTNNGQGTLFAYTTNSRIENVSRLLSV